MSTLGHFVRDILTKCYHVVIARSWCGQMDEVMAER